LEEKALEKAYQAPRTSYEVIGNYSEYTGQVDPCLPHNMHTTHSHPHLNNNSIYYDIAFVVGCCGERASGVGVVSTIELTLSISL